MQSHPFSSSSSPSLSFPQELLAFIKQPEQQQSSSSMERRRMIGQLYFNLVVTKIIYQMLKDPGAEVNANSANILKIIWLEEYGGLCCQQVFDICAKIVINNAIYSEQDKLLTTYIHNVIKSYKPINTSTSNSTVQYSQFQLTSSQLSHNKNKQTNQKVEQILCMSEWNCGQAQIPFPTDLSSIQMAGKSHHPSLHSTSISTLANRAIPCNPNDLYSQICQYLQTLPTCRSQLNLLCQQMRYQQPIYTRHNMTKGYYVIVQLRTWQCMGHRRQGIDGTEGQDNGKYGKISRNGRYKQRNYRYGNNDRAKMGGNQGQRFFGNGFSGSFKMACQFAAFQLLAQFYVKQINIWNAFKDFKNLKAII